MKFQIYYIILFVTLSMGVSAQVINTGGGGPDEEINKINKNDDDDENVLVKKQRIERIRKDLNQWIELAKIDWNNCYTKKLKAENIIEVYTQLSVMGEMKPPKLKKKALDKMAQNGGEVCEEDLKFKCLFSNERNSSKLYNIISEPSMHDYLKTMEIEKEQSRIEFIKFFKKMMNGKQP